MKAAGHATPCDCLECRPRTICDQHTVAARDRTRIRCEALTTGMNTCDEPTLVCMHVHWNTGNTKGVSFHYYCGPHGAEHGLAVEGLR